MATFFVMRKQHQLFNRVSIWAIGFFISATVCGFWILTQSTDREHSILASPLTEAQQEENDVQALEAKYLAKERASDKAEHKAFKLVQKLSKTVRSKRPLWGRRKWPSYYSNVFTSKDAFSADEPKHHVKFLDVGDDDESIDIASRRAPARATRFHKAASRVRRATTSRKAATQDLYEVRQRWPLTFLRRSLIRHRGRRHNRRPQFGVQRWRHLRQERRRGLRRRWRRQYQQWRRRRRRQRRQSTK